MYEQENIPNLTEFTFEGKTQQVEYVETMKVKEGVECDVYKFVNDPEKDLGIIRIAAGYKTPLQKVLAGDRTIEGHISGKGVLRITNSLGETKTYAVSDDLPTSFSYDVKVGDIMQWESDKDSALEVYEICFPPYQDGRFENLD